MTIIPSLWLSSWSCDCHYVPPMSLLSLSFYYPFPSLTLSSLFLQYDCLLLAFIVTTITFIPCDYHPFLQTIIPALSLWLYLPCDYQLVTSMWFPSLFLPCDYHHHFNVTILPMTFILSLWLLFTFFHCEYYHFCSFWLSSLPWDNNLVPMIIILALWLPSCLCDSSPPHPPPCDSRHLPFLCLPSRFLHSDYMLSSIACDPHPFFETTIPSLLLSHLIYDYHPLL